MKLLEKTPGTLFVAFSGKKQVGKDTSADMLMDILEQKGMKVAVTAFAEALKEMTINILGLDRVLVYGSNEDKETLTHISWEHIPLEIRMVYSKDGLPIVGQMTIREVLQVVGTNIFRLMLENDVWANSPFRRDWSEYDVVIITDCRFPNEKEITEKHGGIVIRLTRDTGLVDDHSSETALDEYEFKYTYDNNGSFEDLENYLRELFQ